MGIRVIVNVEGSHECELSVGGMSARLHVHTHNN